MLYVTGDMHGDLSRFADPALRRLKKGDTLFVCGDFGFIWNDSRKEKAALKKLSRLKYTVAFLDGVHENFDLLADYPVEEWHGGRAQRIADNVWHLLRGELYEPEGVRIFTFGGGESAEHELREAHKTWWEQEMPSAEEMTAGLRRLEKAGNEVDYILTHEPSGKADGYLDISNKRLDGVNVYLNQLEERVTCRSWFFGSLHCDKRLSKHHVAVFRKVHPLK